MFKRCAQIIRNEEIAESVCRMALKTDAGALSGFIPGQFANIKIPGRGELLLRRPFSISRADAKTGEFEISYRIAGKGTQEMSKLRPGAKIDALLPLGKGFRLSDGERLVYLVGGGIGVAPLLAVPGKWKKEYRAFFGYRNAGCAFGADEMNGSCGDVVIATDDGSAGYHGFVTQALEERLRAEKPDAILACGPLPMLRELKRLAGEYGVPAQVSMEQRMGCGFGACAVCACAVNGADGPDYKKVCADGPVFDINEVIL